MRERINEFSLAILEKSLSTMTKDERMAFICVNEEKFGKMKKHEIEIVLEDEDLDTLFEVTKQVC